MIVIIHLDLKHSQNIFPKIWKIELEDEDEYYDSSSSENSPKILNPQNNWDLKDYDDWELEC